MEIYENLCLNNLNGEIWKIIDNFPDYQISNYGRIKSLKFGKEKILKQLEGQKGYLYIDLFDKKCFTKVVHRLVYETFIDKLEKNEIIHHVDNNKKNNNINNLIKINKLQHDSYHSKGRIFSESHKNKLSEKKKGINNPRGMLNKHHSDETKDKLSNIMKNKFKDSNYLKGENSPRSTLSSKEVIQIKKLIKLKFKNIEIAKKYKVKPYVISQIKIGKSWKHV